MLTEEVLRQITSYLAALTAADEEFNNTEHMVGVYIEGPVTLRTRDAVIGTLEAIDDFWYFVPAKDLTP